MSSSLLTVSGKNEMHSWATLEPLECKILPASIQDALEVFTGALYVSVADVQIAADRNMLKNTSVRFEERIATEYFQFAPIIPQTPPSSSILTTPNLELDKLDLIGKIYV